MPLKGIPSAISPELLYALARMGHGDSIVIADANFPSDSVAQNMVTQPIRINIDCTASLLRDVLQLLPLDTDYSPHPVSVMARVPADEEKKLNVPAYDAIAGAAGLEVDSLHYIPRKEFYAVAKEAFAIVQTNDCTPYANCIVVKGVLCNAENC